MSEHITHTPQVKRLERSSENKVIAGVCGGLGRYFDLNPSVFRLGLVVLTLLGGAGILVYLAAVLVIPAEGAEQSLAAEVLSQRRDRPWPLIGLALAGVAIAVLLSRADTWPAAGAGWVLILLAGLVVLWATRNDRRGHRVIVVVVAIAGLLAVLFAAAVVTVFAWFNVSLRDGVGDHIYEPSTPAAIRPSYTLGIGHLQIDLSHITPAEETHVKARLGIGELKVIVPSTASVIVDARAKVGDLYVLRHHVDGRNAQVHTGNGGTLFLNLHVGAGRIDVIRAAG